MKLDKKKLTAWVGAAVITLLTPLAHALPTEFVDCGTFECSDPVSGSAWSFGGAALVSASLVNKVHSPTHSAYISSDGTATLTQDVGSLDVPGQAYLYSFWLNVIGSLGSDFTVTLGGRNLLSSSISTIDSPVDGWVQYHAAYDDTFFADGVFTFSNETVAGTTPSSKVFIDDVSVIQFDRVCVPGTPGCGGPTLPEPGTLFLVGAALAAVAAVRRKAKA